MSQTIVSSTAIVPTAKASRYLQQVCKHWEHSFKVEFTPERGTVQFPHNARGRDWPGDGMLFLTAGVTALEVRIEASCAEQLESLQGAVQRHIDRFAFKEAPLAFDWT